jgi:hypothetical protein
MSTREKIANFERIEALVREGKLASMPFDQVRALRHSLLTEAPLSENPKFQQRLQSVETALASRLAQEKSWWETPAGMILIGVVGSLIAAGAAFLLGWV